MGTPSFYPAYMIFSMGDFAMSFNQAFRVYTQFPAPVCFCILTKLDQMDPDKRNVYWGDEYPFLWKH